MSTPDIIDTTTPPRDGLPLIARTVVQCIVRHPEDGTYLMLEKTGWDTKTWSFVTGGVEPSEDPLDAARRELEEEAGYYDIAGGAQFVGEPYGVQFYHEVKKENRRALVYTVALTLMTLVQRNVADEELAIHRPEWVPEERVTTLVHGEGCKRVFKQYLSSQSYYE